MQQQDNSGSKKVSAVRLVQAMIGRATVRVPEK
jgi:hypothetical protein